MLDELIDVIETLKSRIDKHRSVLQGNEAQTRLSLIDPLLRALGWDTADPALVRPEYVVSGRRADYALMNAQSDVVVFLEAKNLGEQLANHRSQVVAYASELGIRFPALTNGNDWEVYDNSQLVPIEQRRVLNVSIANADSAKCALQFLLLWRPNLASGQPIEASEPIIGTEPTTVRTPIFEPQHASPTIAAPSTETPVQAVPAVPDAGLINLRNLHPESGMIPPKVVELPNGEVKQLSKWRDLVVAVSEWLVRDGALTRDRCPIPAKPRSNKRYSVNLEAKHLDGRDFGSKHKLYNGLWLYHGGSNVDIVKRCIVIMEYLGKDPATIHVQVS